jgi:hypothetical protein
VSALLAVFLYQELVISVFYADLQLFTIIYSYTILGEGVGSRGFRELFLLRSCQLVPLDAGRLGLWYRGRARGRPSSR